MVLAAQYFGVTKDGKTQMQPAGAAKCLLSLGITMDVPPTPMTFDDFLNLFFE